MKITSEHIAYALVNHGPMDYRKNLIVQNVYYGWDLPYEADMIVVSSSGYATEIEIKISKSDLLIDKFKEKHKKERLAKISRYFFAVPESLIEIALKDLPEEVGILGVFIKEKGTGLDIKVTTVRPSKRNSKARALTENEIARLARLQNFRYWSRFNIDW
jgi:hypothetical protein